MQEQEKIEVEQLINEIRVALKDVFVAKLRKRGSEIDMEFSNGQSFTLALFENCKKSA